MKYVLLWASLGLAITAQAQVDIGTNTPSPNAVLDVSSATKGLMLPRVSDTLSVRNPSAGLMIFNRKTQLPAIHNGIRWNSLATAAAAPPAGRDSVTYTISGGTYTAGTFGATTLEMRIQNPVVVVGGGGGSGQGRATFSDITLIKHIDTNTVAFLRAVAAGTAGSVVEFKVYTSGAATPYFSVKLTNPRVTDYYTYGRSSARLEELIDIAGTVYGYKDWVSGVSFGWDKARNLAVPY